MTIARGGGGGPERNKPGAGRAARERRESATRRAPDAAGPGAARPRAAGPGGIAGMPPATALEARRYAGTAVPKARQGARGGERPARTGPVRREPRGGRGPAVRPPHRQTRGDRRRGGPGDDAEPAAKGRDGQDLRLAVGGNIRVGRAAGRDPGPDPRRQAGGFRPVNMARPFKRDPGPDPRRQAGPRRVRHLRRERRRRGDRRARGRARGMRCRGRPPPPVRALDPGGKRRDCRSRGPRDAGRAAGAGGAHPRASRAGPAARAGAALPPGGGGGGRRRRGRGSGAGRRAGPARGPGRRAAGESRRRDPGGPRRSCPRTRSIRGRSRPTAPRVAPRAAARRSAGQAGGSGEARRPRRAPGPEGARQGSGRGSRKAGPGAWRRWGGEGVPNPRV